MRIPPLAPGEVPGGLSREAALELGQVPPPLLALARAPEAAQAAWALVREALLRGRLPRTTKELLALAAVAVAGVEPLRALFRDGLQRRGVDPLVLEELEARGETARLPARTQAVLAFGRKAALQPGLLDDADWGRLRREGLDEGEQAELLLAAGAIGLLVHLTRALEG